MRKRLWPGVIQLNRRLRGECGIVVVVVVVVVGFLRACVCAFVGPAQYHRGVNVKNCNSYCVTVQLSVSLSLTHTHILLRALYMPTAFCFLLFQ